MTKIQFTLLSLILAVLLVNSPVSANPMHQIKQVNPIPMFMPLLVKKSEELSLTSEQVSIFAKWRAENMAPAVQATTIIVEGEKAIKQAVLNGTDVSKINIILNDVAKARADLAKRTLRCHAHTKEALTEVQWTQLLDQFWRRRTNNSIMVNSSVTGVCTKVNGCLNSKDMRTFTVIVNQTRRLVKAHYVTKLPLCNNEPLCNNFLTIM